MGPAETMDDSWVEGVRMWGREEEEEGRGEGEEEEKGRGEGEEEEKGREFA